MARIAIIDRLTRALLVLDPPLRADGSPLLPETDCEAVNITDAEAAKLGQNASYAVAPDGTVTVSLKPPPPPDVLRDSVLSQAASAVGVALASLTTAQRNALLVCMLYKAGGLDPATMTVRPLGEWL